MKNYQIKVLTVCRATPQNLEIHKHSIAEFIFEQNNAVEKFGVHYDYYLINSGGLKGYIIECWKFRGFLKEKKYNYDLVHAHGGHIGSLVNTQRKIPVFTTYHGSDINNPINRLFSIIAILFSRKNIFVSSKLFDLVKLHARGIVIPCGVDFNIFKTLDRLETRKVLGFNEKDKIVLFAGRQERKEKNYQLAEKAACLAGVENLIELKDYTREEVNLLLNACDVLLLTSVSEGSPQVIKEAMACNCPVVSTDVGDIKQIISSTAGCYITSFDPSDIAENIKQAFKFNKRTNGRDAIKYLDIQVIAHQIVGLYKKEVLKRK